MAANRHGEWAGLLTTAPATDTHLSFEAAKSLAITVALTELTQFDPVWQHHHFR